MFAQIREMRSVRQIIFDQIARRARHQHLPAVSRRANARRAMHVHSHIPRARQHRFARMQSHPHAQIHILGPRMCRERALRVGGKTHGVGGAEKREKERVALRINFMPVVFFAERAKQIVMLFQQFCVLVPQTFEQFRRTFNVGEHERHRSRWLYQNRRQRRHNRARVRVAARELFVQRARVGGRFYAQLVA